MDADKKYEYGLVAIMFVTWGTVFLDRMSLLYMAPFVAEDLHLSEDQIGLLAAVIAVTWAISTLVFGAVSDRVGRRAVLIPMVLAFSLLSWVSGIARNFGQMLAARAMMGVAEGPCWSVMNALVEQSSAPSRRGRNVGIVVSAAAAIGLAVAPILTTQVAATYGWRVAFFIVGLPGVVMALLIWKFVKEPKAADGGDRREKVTAGEVLALLRQRNIWLCCIGSAGFMSWLFLQNVFAPLYIVKVAHQPATTAGFLMGAAGLGSFIFGFVAPALSDRFGRRQVLLAIAAISTILPLALLAPPLYEHLWLLAGILFLTQGGQAISVLVIVLIPAESVPKKLVASAIGLVTLFGELFGGTLAPMIGGQLAESYGLGITQILAACGTALVFLVGLALRETRPQAI